MRCAVLQSCTHNLQISVPNLTTTLTPPINLNPCMSSQNDFSQYSARLGYSAYTSHVANTSDLHAVSHGNKLCKYANDTYLLVPAVSVNTRASELKNITGWTTNNNLVIMVCVRGQYRQFSVPYLGTTFMCFTCVVRICRSTRWQTLYRFLCRSTRLGFYSQDLPSFVDLCHQADNSMFRKVLHSSEHVLHSLLLLFLIPCTIIPLPPIDTI